MSKFIFTHDTLADLIEWKHPTLQRNRDFVTAHTCRPNSDEQKGEAFISGWYISDVEPPNLTEMLSWRDEFAATTDASAQPDGDAP